MFGAWANHEPVGRVSETLDGKGGWKGWEGAPASQPPKSLRYLWSLGGEADVSQLRQPVPGRPISPLQIRSTRPADHCPKQEGRTRFRAPPLIRLVRASCRAMDVDQSLTPHRHSWLHRLLEVQTRDHPVLVRADLHADGGEPGGSLVEEEDLLEDLLVQSSGSLGGPAVGAPPGEGADSA